MFSLYIYAPHPTQNLIHCAKRNYHQSRPLNLEPPLHSLLLNSVNHRSLEQGLNFTSESVQITLWFEVLHDLALTVDQEFGKVPGYLIYFWLKVCRCLGLEILVNRVCIVSVDVTLLKDGELVAKFTANIVMNLILSSRFLTSKLITGKG